MQRLLIGIALILSLINSGLYIFYNLEHIRENEIEIIKLLTLSLVLVISYILTKEKIKEKLKSYFLVPLVVFPGLIIGFSLIEVLTFKITNYILLSVLSFSLSYPKLRRKFFILIPISSILPLILFLVIPNLLVLLSFFLTAISSIIYITLSKRGRTKNYTYANISVILLIYFIITTYLYLAREENKLISLLPYLATSLSVLEVLIFSYKRLKILIINTISLVWLGLMIVITSVNFPSLPTNIVISNTVSVIFLISGLLAINFLEIPEKKINKIIFETTQIVENIIKEKLTFKSEFELIETLNFKLKYIQISIIPENKLPIFIINKMILKNSLSLDEISHTDKDTISFFKNFGLIFIQRLPSELDKINYILIKYPPIKNFLNIESIKREVDKLRPLCKYIAQIISNLLIISSQKKLDKQREHQVREIESFERVNYFLIREEEQFVFRDKKIAYKFLEDFEKPRGYYLDVVFKKNGMALFLIYIPDILMLSKFTLLSIKGIIKTLEPEEITYERIKEISEEFVKSRDLPLTISINFLAIEGNEMTIYPSPFFRNYVILENQQIIVEDNTKLNYDIEVITSNKSLNLNGLTGKPKDERIKFIKDNLWQTRESDTLLIVYF
ncbi:MAG: hypothetical protein ACP5KI_04560 [Brevinematia bacterium]